MLNLFCANSGEQQLSAGLVGGSGLDVGKSPCVPLCKMGNKSERETKDALHLHATYLVHHRSCGVFALSRNREVSEAWEGCQVTPA